MGPGPIGLASNPNAGRISGVAADPTDPDTIYVAASGGGVWKTTDGGNDWTPLTDDQATLSMGAIAIAPSDPDVLYAGTGEAHNSGDSFYGRGILVSTDSGATWTLTGQSAFDRRTVAQIAVDPTDPFTAYAAVSSFAVNGLLGNTGIWKTTDGGQTWADTTAGISTQEQFSDVVVSSADLDVVFAAVGTFFGSPVNGVYRSTDGGATWGPAGNFPIGAANGRIRLAISESSPNVVYASISDPATDNILSIRKSTDGGQTWAPTTQPPEYLGGQAWFNSMLAVSPFNPNIVFAGGTSNLGAAGIIESRDGGLTWAVIRTGIDGVSPQVDSHGATFDAFGRLLNATDGGVWRLDNAFPGNITWSNLNGDLEITQFTGIALHPTDPNIAYAGSQDHGTVKFVDTPTWTRLLGGNGGYVRVDPNQPNTVYHTFTFNSLERSDNGGATWTNISAGIQGTGNFYSYYTLDPGNPARILFGTDRINVSPNRGATWTAISTPGTAGWPSTGTVNAIGVAKTDGNVVYAAVSGNVLVTTDGGASWTSRPVPGGGVSEIDVDPDNSQVAYAVRGVFGGGHVFKTTDGGQTWTDISGNLPDLPTNTFALVRKTGGDALLAGTDTGLYASFNGGASWARYKAGQPNAQVVEVEYAPATGILAIGTHSRGLYETQGIQFLIVQAISPGQVTELQALSNVVVGHFDDLRPPLAAGSYTAQINWGDGTITAGQVVSNPAGGFDVLGSHAYGEGGSSPLTITVSDPSTYSESATTTVDIADLPLLVLDANDIDTTEGAQLSGVTLGTFFDTDPRVFLASHYQISIDWGDGTGVSAGVPSGPPGQTFDALGSHVYTTRGTYTYSATITASPGGAQVVITGTARVAISPLTTSIVPFTPTEGLLFNGQVARFTTPNTLADATQFTAIVDWGNGRTSPGLVSADPVAGGFTISSSNLYTRAGTYPLSVTIYDKGELSATAPASSTYPVVVLDAAISALGSVINLVEGQPFAPDPANPQARVVASFTDGNPFGTAADFTAQVIWGDGTVTDGVIVPIGFRQYVVQGSHTYTRFNVDASGVAGFSMTVKINEGQPSQGVVTTPVRITDAPITVTPSSQLTVVEGQQIDTVLATFVDANPFADASEYVVSADWGDGSAPDAGTVTLVAAGLDPATQNPLFEIRGSGKSYQFGQYPISVSIAQTRPGGVSAETSTTIAVTDAPLATDPADSVELVAEEGKPFSLVVAIFSDANLDATKAQNTAIIDWGDGSSPSPGEVEKDPATGKWLVTGGHVYGVGRYDVHITITGNGGSQASAEATVDVPNAPIQVTNLDIDGVDEGARFNGTIATFHDANPRASAADYVATITWDDGSKTINAPIVFNESTGDFEVRATRVFTRGVHPFKVQVKDSPGNTTVVGSPDGQFHVDDAPIANAQGVSDLSMVEGTLLVGTLATFTDLNPLGQPGDWTAAISYRRLDQSGNPTGAAVSIPAGVIQVVNNIGGGFAVTARHALPVGSFRLDVSITSKADAANAATVSDDVVVSNAPLALSPTTSLSVQGAAFGGILARFTDGNPDLAPGDYAVLINWAGEGLEAGKLVSQGGGRFDVVAATPHVFKGVRPYAIEVTVTDDHGESRTVQSTVNVSNAPLGSMSLPFQATERVAFSGAVAAFGDGNRDVDPGKYVVTVEWGDGTVSGGTVRRDAKLGFVVTASHTYLRAGDRNVVVTISDGEGGTTVAVGSVNVADHIVPITGSIAPVSDRGPSNADGITNDRRPIFVGHAESGDKVTLYAIRSDLPVPVPVGQGVAGADGGWGIQTAPLADGVYSIVATAVDADGRSSSPVEVILTSPSGAPLVIDTQAPHVTGVALDPRQARVYITIQDDRVGLDDAALSNPSNYSLGLPNRAPLPLSGITISPGLFSTPRAVLLSFAGGRLKSGGYNLSIAGAGLTDLAGNALEGGFYKPVNRPGAPYVAQLSTDGNTSSGPVLPGTGVSFRSTRGRNRR